MMALATAAPAAPAAAAAGHAALSKPRKTSCAEGPAGRPVSCPPPLRIAQLPPGARNRTRVSAPVQDPAAMVDTRTWTTGGGNTFPGADVPFGMVQWSPDTMPHNSDGGGYSYGDPTLWGYSLTHLSGPGCPSAGDIPILPMTGALPGGDPGLATTSFTKTGEIAQAGYYSARSNLPNTITSQFTATTHSAMGRFTFPATTKADFLIKLVGSQHGNSDSSASIVGHNEVTGSATTGNFCKETSSSNNGLPALYTVHFDIVFSRSFTASKVVTQPGQSHPDVVFLTFNTTSNPVIDAKVAISYVSRANAQLDMQTENPGWDFTTVQNGAQRSWNTLLGRIAVSGGSVAQTQQFYSLLYKSFLQPNITSDVSGQYLGSDMKVHTLASGQQNQYGTFSGWDIYHSLSQLQAMLDPSAASDMAQSLVNYYAQNAILPRWGYLNLDYYVMVGDPADAIISDIYAFGGRSFNTGQALADMLRQATTVNTIRPGEALESRYGYLPQDGTYGCCHAHGFLPALLEYNTADFALAQFATAMGDTTDAAMLQKRASNWLNTFDPATGLLSPRLKSGSFVPGVTPTTKTGYVEGDAYEYLWNVPNDYAGLFSVLGGASKVVPALRQYLSKPNGFGMHAELTNEFDLGEQNALDYAGDPAGTQQVVANIRNNMYRPGPSGLPNNDDLGANSATYIWDMLGMYPENPGSGNLVFSSPGFPSEVITLPSGKQITISAPGASPTEYYVHSLSVNGASYDKLYIPFSTLAQGATLDWSMSTAPTAWGTAPRDAPPSYGPSPGTRLRASTSPGSATFSH
ncbi:MAG TPA: GH92 family glycosyl hydrolase [Streptosporangiaceae bacterium]|nr:GH92 family glycosyl hydrolase [Streptosporangiaceae bacterium]